MIAGFGWGALTILFGYMGLFAWGNAMSRKAADETVWLFSRATGRDRLAAIGFCAAFGLAFFGPMIWLVLPRLHKIEYRQTESHEKINLMKKMCPRFTTSVLALIILVVAGPSFADNSTEIKLPLGSVIMTQTYANNDLTLITDVDILTFQSAYLPEVEALSGNSFLIFLATGEHKCAGYYIWGTLDDAGLRASPQFGSCSNRGKVLRTAKGLMLIMPGPNSSAAVRYYLNRDGTVTENTQGLEAEGIVDPF
ncbi:hypothetical protein [Loktanella sp. M215]|uniref:hypothetical protein n=1 Tax=Loktanella sp. M215 TaxID=2675431 RepID=UPI001F17D1DC|nr:hypothetical protein [Loktanella sp. M215]MCF7702091.1 hypothetical protein [Loktanella sp. M215]